MKIKNPKPLRISFKVKQERVKSKVSFQQMEFTLTKRVTILGQNLLSL